MSIKDADHRAGRASEFYHITRKGPTRKRIWRKLHKDARRASKRIIEQER